MKREPVFTKVDFGEVLDPRQFVGRSPQQVEEFIADHVEPILHGAAQVPLAGGRGPVAVGLEPLDERDLIGRQRPVQLLGAGVVRIPPGEEAGAAGAARTGRDEGPVALKLLVPPVIPRLCVAGVIGSPFGLDMDDIVTVP